MQHLRMWGLSAILSGLLLTTWLIPSTNAQELELGRVINASTSDENVAALTFRAKSAGVLTVVVRSTDESDLILVVTDADGQQLPEGRSDQDIGGDNGAEQLAVTIPRTGTYVVRVETFLSGSADFKIGASWLAFADLEVAADPDGSPSTAIPISAGQQTISESINGALGDYWDWFVFSADGAGTLTVATRADEGDLVLEAFRENEFSEALERSDQDLQGINGNEALTLLVAAGQKLYFKVSSFSEGASVPYRLQIGFMPD
ncbi:MAG: hypothetical protein AMS18_07720 [Gemmatimonas sp. SG8_17]|nr:MAG: hypothetical protein AMS18_07720 [Gemmatimonas sp. SG8_17]